MPWIPTVSESEATGDLKRQYEVALKREGHVGNILKLFSLRPDILRTFTTELYLKLMHGPSDLSRVERELVATVVSSTNHCHY